MIKECPNCEEEIYDLEDLEKVRVVDEDQLCIFPDLVQDDYKLICSFCGTSHYRSEYYPSDDEMQFTD